MTQQTFTHAQLAVSPLNVRFDEEAIARVEALAASIVAEGLIEPLCLHPVAGKPAWAKTGKSCAQFGVYAGGRRFRAIGLAIADGRLPADFPIAASLREDLTEAEIVLLSLEENLLRRDLEAWEVHRAVARSAELGMDPSEIARRSGQSADFVARQLRLGQLDPQIFEAYAAGQLTVDQAKAYAATGDHALQRAAFTHFASLSTWESSADRIRAWLKVGDRELARLLALVGEDNYRAAGGSFELDLFAGEEAMRGRVVDEGLLRELAEGELAEVRIGLRQELVWPDLRFQPDPPQFADRDDHSLSIPACEASQLSLPAQRSQIVATLAIDDQGKVEPHFWWASRSAKGAALRAASGLETGTAASAIARDTPIPVGAEAIDNPDSSYSRYARELVRDLHGLTADGLQAVRSIRRALLRAVLLLDAGPGKTLARDYLTWAQLRQALGDHFGSARRGSIGARGLAGEEWAATHDAEPQSVRPWLDDCIAEHMWREGLAELAKQPWMAEPDPATSLTLWLDLPAADKRRAEAVLAGLSLLRSVNAPGWRVAVHDVLAERAGATPERLRLLWRPDRGFVGLFGKLQRLAMARPFVPAEVLASWSRQKDKPLTEAVVAAFDGECGGSAAPAARRWVHPLLAFGPAENEHGPEPMAAAPQTQPSSSEAVGQESIPA